MYFVIFILLVWLFWLERRFTKLCEKIDYDVEMIYDKLEQKQQQINDLYSKIDKNRYYDEP